MRLNSRDTGFFFVIIILMISIIFIISIPTPKEKKVVVYVAEDQDYSEPILREFENITGIKVYALYDTEATKTVGLVNRVLAEKNNPNADVFWNNEVVRTILLKKRGVLQPYCSPNAADIPDAFKDKNCYWTGFGARARVILYNTEKIQGNNTPNSLYDFTNPKWKGKACISNPLIGTGSALNAALFAAIGKTKAEELLLNMKSNGVHVLESPSMVRDQVVAGECWFGSTDTDDAYDAILLKKSVKMVIPDQGAESMGTLVIPNSVMLIKGAKHPAEAKKLIDFLLSPHVEESLAKSAIQIPLNRKSQVPKNIPKNIKPFNTTFEKMYNHLEDSNKFIQETFIR